MGIAYGDVFILNGISANSRTIEMRCGKPPQCTEHLATNIFPTFSTHLGLTYFFGDANEIARWRTELIHLHAQFMEQTLSF